MDDQLEMSYGELNGHVTDGVMHMANGTTSTTVDRYRNGHGVPKMYFGVPKWFGTNLLW